MRLFWSRSNSYTALDDSDKRPEVLNDLENDRSELNQDAPDPDQRFLYISWLSWGN